MYGFFAKTVFVQVKTIAMYYGGGIYYILCIKLDIRYNRLYAY